MPGTSSISGIISGLDTSDIISKLMELERQPVTNLQARQATLTSKLTAWQSANTRILALKVKADALAQTATFGTKTVSSSDPDIITGSASSDAIEGTYYITVNAIAKAQQQKSVAGYADTTTTALGAGTISIQVGAGETKSILINETNNTLAGIAKAINNADAGVTASIINDGSESNPYRLIVTSNTLGTAGEAAVTVDLTGGPGLGFTDLQAAQDASLTLGSGAGAIEVTKPTNDVTDVIPGVNLTLLGADEGKTVTVTVRTNTTAVKTAIMDFVDQYNNLISFINAQFAYDAELNQAGTLFADINLQSIQSDLIQRLSNPVTGLAKEALNVLGEVGVTMGQDNSLTINNTQLDSALSGSMSQVMRLFATVGDTTNASITYVASTGKTKASSSVGYAISITAAASQAWVKAGVRQTEDLAESETLTINGVNVNLTAGMSQTEVVAAINASSGQTGVTASADDGYLVLTRTAYGSAPGVSVISNRSNGGGTPTADTSGIGNVKATQSESGGEAGTGAGAAGVNVAGTINGEAATGSGQFLTGNTGNLNTEGLKIKVTAATAGDYGTIRFTKGIASQISDYSVFATAADTGLATNAEDSLRSQIQDITDEVTAMNERLAAKEERLTAQFTAMEAALSKLQSQGDYLTSQIDAMNANWKKTS